MKDIEDVKDWKSLDFGDPRIRLMDGRTVVTVFVYRVDQWSEVGHQSRAERRFHERRRRELDSLPSGPAREDRRAHYDREARGHVRRVGHRVQLIGNELFEKAYRPELWNGVPLHDIPGYREVYDFGGGRTFRAEELFPVLDILRDAGVPEVQLDHLKGEYERRVASR
ncbi:MAG: hypothetical protein M3Q22_11555 [Actinomycetota bacterium]|nr:hypothetical protein [Actinomycetota bacterium]